MNLNYEYVVGRRLNSRLLYVLDEKQLYTKKSMKNENYFYNCYIKTCKARVFVNNEVCKKVKNFIDHSHETQENMYKELKTLNDIKTSCVEMHTDYTEPTVLGGIRKIYQSACVT